MKKKDEPHIRNRDKPHESLRQKRFNRGGDVDQLIAKPSFTL
jgi:hypothetical protein